MSLILEALRKSEAERRRGQTPDLLSDATPAAPAVRVATRNASAMLAVIVATLVTLVLVGWWLRSAAQPDSTLATAEATDSVSAAVPAAPSATAPSPARAAPPLPPAAAATAPAAASPAVPLSPAPRTPPAPTPSAPGAMATTAPAVTSPASTVSVPVPRPLPLPPPEPGAVSTGEPSPAPPAFGSQHLPLRLSDLSTDERQQLPTLKVSMHMWASDAANRFAIIDGTRVNEGDRVGQATVEAIEQDGVLLAWHGRRIRLPIR